MVVVFTKTTSHLAHDFVEGFVADKLATILLKVAKETGVEFVCSAKPFCIVGQWHAVIQAYSSLERYFETRADDSNVKDYSESMQVCWNNKNDASAPNTEKQMDAVSYLESDAIPFVPVSDSGKRGRKPGTTILKSTKNLLPDPVVQYRAERADQHENFKLYNAIETAMLNNCSAIHVKNDNEQTKYDEHASDMLFDKTPDKNMSNSKTQGLEQDFQESVSTFQKRDDNPHAGSLCKVVKQEARAFDVVMSEDTDIEENNNAAMDEEVKLDSCQYTNLPETKMKVKEKSKLLFFGKISKRKSKPKKYIGPDYGIKAEKSSSQFSLSSSEIKKTETVQKRQRLVKVDEDEMTKFKCDICDYIGTKRSNLTTHIQRQHKQKHICDICGRKFGIKKEFRRHVNQVHSNPSHFCGLCHKFYKEKRKYDDHMKSHQSDYVKPQFGCEVCSKTFSTKYVLANHIKSEHQGIKKSYLCPTCGRSFTQKNSYIMHANVHAGIKPFVCDICGKSFSYEKSLKEHKFMHDELRRFKCDVCLKTFRQTSALHIHMKVHKDIKDHICPTCGKGFTQKQALVRHERIHSGDKPYSCALCSRRFSDYSIIRRHMIMLHKRDPKEWQEHVVSSLLDKTDFYIEGGSGPEHLKQKRFSKKSNVNEAVEIPYLYSDTISNGSAFSVYMNSAD